jgi:hypothetical protein
LRSFGGKPDGKRPLARPRHRWGVSTVRYLELEDGRECTGFFDLKTEAVACEHGNEALVFIK